MRRLFSSSPVGGGAAVIVLLVGILNGCASVDPNFAMMNNTVVPVPSGEATAVSAYSLADAMLKAGFTRDEVLDYGTELRNALATSGGAQIRRGKIVEAIFAVHAQELYVTSRTRGTFREELFPDTPAT